MVGFKGLSFEMDYHAGYFADQPPFHFRVNLNGKVEYFEENRTLSSENKSGHWKLSQVDQEHLADLINRLFEFEVEEDEFAVCDGGSTNYKVKFKDGTKKEFYRSHHADMPFEFVKLEHEIEALLTNKYLKLREDSKNISISTTPCYGECPVYNLEIDQSGEVLFSGMQFVATPGFERWTLPVRILIEVNEIAQEIYDFEPSVPEEGMLTDMPSFKIKFVNGLKSTESEFYMQECENMTELESLIDQLHSLLGVNELIFGKIELE